MIMLNLSGRFNFRLFSLKLKGKFLFVKNERQRCSPTTKK
jgi:hypothetical protein